MGYPKMMSGHSRTRKTWQCQKMVAAEISKARISISTKKSHPKLYMSSIYVCIYMYIYVRVYMYVCIYICMYVYICIYMYVYMFT